MEKVIEMIPVEETKEKKKNKGFSLVELIIVIAIMAILVGVVGTQALPYIERPRVARDQQVLSAISTSTLTAFSENAAVLDPTATYTLIADSTHNFTSATAPAAVLTSFTELNAYDTYTDLTNALVSRASNAMTALTITYNAATGEVTVTPTGSTLTAVTAR